MPRTSTALVREIQTIRASFRQLAKSFTRIAPHLTAIPDFVDAPAGVATRRKPRMSGAQRAALKLQGKYMGTMRGLKPRQRAAVKKIRAAKGILAAIAFASRMAPHPTEAPGRAATNNDGRARRKPRLTAARRAAMKVQGKYMGALRALKPGQRAKVKAIRAAKGINAAIRAAQRMG